MIYFAMLATGNIKIGKTVNLIDRMKSFPIDRYSRDVIVVLGVHDGYTEEEQELRRQFDHIRIKRYRAYRRPEDFRPTLELLAYIGANCEVTEVVEEANQMLRENRSDNPGMAPSRSPRSAIIEISPIDDPASPSP